MKYSIKAERVASFAIVAISTSVSFGMGSAAYAADPPKEQLPSQEKAVPEDAPRVPRVIDNPQPTKEDKLGATEVKDDNPSTVESVDESRLPKRLTPEATDPRFRVKATKVRKTMALALGGGGARGAAHIGVLRVLAQEGIPIDYIVGNSMGAIVGGLYSAGVDLSQIESLGTDGKLRKQYVPRMAKLLLMPISKLTQPFRKEQLAGLVSGNRFERYIDKLIPEGSKDMENLRIPFSAVATNLIDGKAYRISEGKLSTAIRASSTISPLLRPVRIGDKIYIDGGLRANLPASSARDTGADVVVGVLVDEPLRELEEKNFYRLKGIAARMADVVLAVTDEYQLQFADVIINPDVSGIPILCDKPESVAKAIHAGEVAARKAIPLIRKKMGLPEGAKLVESDGKVPLRPSI